MMNAILKGKTAAESSHLALSAVLVLAGISVAGLASADGDTWYLNTSAGTSTSSKTYLQPVTNGSYWTSMTTGEKGTDINSTDTYVVQNNYRFSINSAVSFGGKELVIGDLSAEKWTCIFYFNGHVKIPNGTLVWTRGYATHGTNSKSTYNINCPVSVMSPKPTPFGLRSETVSTTINAGDKLSGDSTVGLIVGGNYNGSEITRMTATNVTFNLGSLDNYHGALTCVSANDGPSLTVGNVMVNVTPSPAFAGSLEIENGVRLTLSDIGELRADGLKLHDGAILRYAYSGATTSVIRVSSAFTIPETDGKVYLSFSSTIADATDKRDFPLLIVPDTQELSTNSFAMCGIAEPQWATGELAVVPDAVARTKTLVWRVYGSRRLQTADSVTYASSASTGATLTSALSEGQESQWSPAELPSDGNVYVFGQESGYGNCLRTPWGLTEDYVFPGQALKTIGSQAFLVLANSCGFKADIVTSASTFFIRVYNGKDPTLDGRLVLENGVSEWAYNSSVLTVASELSGDGTWLFSNYEGTGSPSATTWFVGDNSAWLGTMKVRPLSSNKGAPSENYHLTVGFSSSASFGGPLDELNYRALTLLDYAQLSITNDVTMAADLNRGLCVTNNAIINVAANCTLACNWPVTMSGRLIKKGTGALALGGPVKYVDAEGEITDIPPESDAMRKLDFRAGSIKVLRHDSVNGMLVCGTAPIKLALDFNSADADLKRYGFYNVKTDAPFAEGKAICIELQNVDAAALTAARQTASGYKQGLITVKTSAADNVADNLTLEKIAGLKVIREDDSETGYTTFSAYGKQNGLILLFR